MNGENDHLFDESHLDLCIVCGKQDCECPPDDAPVIIDLVAVLKASLINTRGTRQ